MERTQPTASIQASPEVSHLLVSGKKLSPDIPVRLSPLLIYLEYKMQTGIAQMREQGQSVFIAGPDWCRDNAVVAGQYHSEVILQTYGDTYALPNKDPKVNTWALNSGNLDMFLLFSNDKPVGTACMVAERPGIAELGRAASLGRVGNRVIQDMRIMRWLTDRDVSRKFHTLFATCRTAPDRNIGTGGIEQIMRGGQAVSHMWETMPNVKVAGFGPFYKKHGALEQFAYSFITRGEIVVNDMWIKNAIDANFVKAWLDSYELDVESTQIIDDSSQGFGDAKFHISYPPFETGITDLVHGEIELGKGELSLSEAVRRLSETGVPFMQIRVPVDRDTLAMQSFLRESGFQSFMFTPGLRGIQSPALWFGKLNANVPVVPTFWEGVISMENPFWGDELAEHSNRIAKNWQY